MVIKSCTICTNKYLSPYCVCVCLLYRPSLAWHIKHSITQRRSERGAANTKQGHKLYYRASCIWFRSQSWVTVPQNWAKAGDSECEWEWECQRDWVRAGIGELGLGSGDWGLALTSTPAATAHPQNLWLWLSVVVVVLCVLAMMCRNAQKTQSKTKRTKLR